tara:strand:+ start:425 stop:574 length:150 start_codon:yes stop_codon:yes gene_type:complete
MSIFFSGDGFFSLFFKFLFSQATEEMIALMSMPLPEHLDGIDLPFSTHL